MINTTKFYGAAMLVAAVCLASAPAISDVLHYQKNSSRQTTHVSDDPWQPDGFVNGTNVPATWVDVPGIVIDGADDEAAWSQAVEVEVPLYFGTVDRAWLKAVYTDDEVFIRVRWEDSTEDRQHHPWVWDAADGRYVAGPQVEDSVLLSFEAGCEWTPSLLSGYIYDFDAWQWMAARSDPIGQAVDLYGNVQDRDTRLADFRPYSSRDSEGEWQLKFAENHDVDLYADWDELDRVYMLHPSNDKLWVRAVPDGGSGNRIFVNELPPPESAPEDFSQAYPQFSPVRLTGSAGEVAAGGQWRDGYWTVEFRRARVTPVKHIYDTVFNRMVQFSVYVFDHVEEIDEASESDRLFLQFLRPEEKLAKN